MSETGSFVRRNCSSGPFILRIRSPDLFFPEQGLACGGVQLVAREAEFGVGIFSDRIVAEHLEGDFAAISFLGDVLDFFQHALAQTVASKSFQNHHVVDVDQGATGEGGYPLEAIHQSRGLAVNVGQDRKSIRVLGQFLYQVCLREVAQRNPAAHGVRCISIQNFRNLFPLLGVTVVGLNNLNVHVQGLRPNLRETQAGLLRGLRGRPCSHSDSVHGAVALSSSACSCESQPCLAVGPRLILPDVGATGFEIEEAGVFTDAVDIADVGSGVFCQL